MENNISMKDFNNSKEKLISFLEHEYKKSQVKLMKSRLMYISLNLLSLLMSATIVILTMIVIGKKIGGADIQAVFVSISIITSTVTLISGVNSIFQFKKRKENYAKKIEAIELMKQKFVTRVDQQNEVEKHVIRVGEKLFDLEDNFN